MKTQTQENKIVEARDPVAYPHFPQRPAKATHPIIRIIAKEEQPDQTTDHQKTLE